MNTIKKKKLINFTLFYFSYLKKLLDLEYKKKKLFKFDFNLYIIHDSIT